MFGSRAAERLARDPDLDLVLCGRNAERAEKAAAALNETARAAISHAVIDASSVDPRRIEAVGANIVIDASGPFQTASYNLAKACIGARCHYIDLADARAYVTGITGLDDAARGAGVLVASGASSVPGLSSAVVAAYAGKFQCMRKLEIGISPGNGFDPGLSTMASVLSSVGQPIEILARGSRVTVYGWQGLRRRRIGGAGERWLGYVDVPDLELFPKAYPDLESVSFQAGLELSLFHFFAWASSRPVRAGLIRSLAPLAPALLAVKRSLNRFGGDVGGMFVTMYGIGPDGRDIEVNWELTAGSGHGPYVPTLASTALAKRLARGAEHARGAKPCFGLVPLADFEAERDGLDISWGQTQRP
ncbi:MAG: saccharopine dehydrogenase NADP-binding domain-containing protein [Hyphomicrobium sp.]